MKITIHIISLCLLISGNICLSQNNYTIDGKVINDDNKSISDVGIFIKSDNSIYTLSDIHGNFSIKVPRDKYNDTLVFYHIAYNSVSLDVKKIIEDGKLIVTLSKNKNRLSEIVLSSDNNSIDSEFSTEKLTKFEIYASPSYNGDIIGGINFSRMSTNTEETPTLNLRGSPEKRSMVFINNVPLYRSNLKENFLNSINNVDFLSVSTSSIGNIEIYPSNPPVYFSNTSGGLINMNTPYTMEDRTAIFLSPIVLSLGLEKDLKQTMMLQANLYYVDLGLFRKFNFQIKDYIDYYRRMNGEITMNVNLDRTKIKIYSALTKDKISFSDFFSKDRNTIKSDVFKSYNVANIHFFLENVKIKFNSGISKILDSTRVKNYSSIDQNLTYYYSSLSANYFLEKSRFYGGLTFERAINREKEQMYVEPFIGSTYTISSNITIGAGVRKTVYNYQKLNPYSYNFLMKFSDEKNHNRFILSAGHYESLDFIDFNSGILKSNQITVEYNYEKDNHKAGISLYKKRDKDFYLKDRSFIYGDRDTYGLELSYKMDKEIFSTELSYLFIRSLFSYGKYNFRELDFPYFFKGLISVYATNSIRMSLSFISRPGSLYTPIKSNDYDISTKKYFPILSEDINGNRYNSYHRLDFSIDKSFSLKEMTIMLIGKISNLLDRKNERIELFDYASGDVKKDLYQEREFFIALVLML
ncbi:TonB-dependent receptor [Ichthyobacterium seriolicida]|nr:Plug domain-containing protein [Ichthyobacterium seriolicida]